MTGCLLSGVGMRWGLVASMAVAAMACSGSSSEPVPGADAGTPGGGTVLPQDTGGTQPTPSPGGGTVTPNPGGTVTPNPGGTADTGGTVTPTPTPGGGTILQQDVGGTAAPPGSCSAPEPSHQGEGTYYTFADGSGNCMFPATPNDLDIGAMNQTDYASSAACGRCARVKGPKGELTIRIVDRCPECAPGDIDFSPSAFAKIAETSAGRVPIQWSYVPCNVAGSVVYHFKDGSNPWWTGVQVRNHRHGIARFEYKDEQGKWVEVERQDFNYFINASGMGPGPYSFRVTDVYGGVIEDQGIALRDDADSPGTAQFSACK